MGKKIEMKKKIYYNKKLINNTFWLVAKQNLLDSVDDVEIDEAVELAGKELVLHQRFLKKIKFVSLVNFGGSRRENNAK